MWNRTGKQTKKKNEGGLADKGRCVLQSVIVYVAIPPPVLLPKREELPTQNIDRTLGKIRSKTPQRRKREQNTYKE